MGKSPNGYAFAAGLPVPVRARGGKPIFRPAKPVPALDQSAVLRGRLVAKLDGVQSADQAALSSS
jgi:hypothetical protein